MYIAKEDKALKTNNIEKERRNGKDSKKRIHKDSEGKRNPP